MFTIYISYNICVCSLNYIHGNCCFSYAIWIPIVCCFSQSNKQYCMGVLLYQLLKQNTKILITSKVFTVEEPNLWSKYET